MTGAKVHECGALVQAERVHERVHAGGRCLAVRCRAHGGIHTARAAGRVHPIAISSSNGEAIGKAGEGLPQLLHGAIGLLMRLRR